jgi:flagellar hook assembly protein FlgD
VIEFSLPEPGRVHLRIYGARGEWMRTLLDGELPAGPHARMWDALDANGRAALPGVYFIRLEYQGAELTGRLVILGR